MAEAIYNDDEAVVIPFAPDYSITPSGVVTRIKDTRNYKAGRKLTPFKNANGYTCVKLAIDGKYFKFPLHRAVALTFLGPAPEGRKMACHNDGDKDHNHARNLRWDDGFGNMADKLRHGTHQRGEKCGTSKLTNAQIADIRSRARYQGLVRDLAAEFGVHTATITSIRRGRRRVYD